MHRPLDPSTTQAAIAGAEALISRAFGDRPQRPGSGPRVAAYEAPAPRRVQSVPPALAQANSEALRRFVTLALAGGISREGDPAEAAAYLGRAADRLGGFLASLDGCGAIPRHMIGVEASDIALARDRLQAAAFAAEVGS